MHAALFKTFDEMNHFIGYHNADERGPYFRRARNAEARTLKFFTAKQFRTETLVGNRLWIITGKGSPRLYELVGSGTMRSIERGPRPAEYRRPSHQLGSNITFSVDYLPEPIDVSDSTWFRKLLAEQQNFSRGLNRISSESVIEAFESARAEKNGLESKVLADLKQIETDNSIDRTTREALINARLGQGKFRYDVETRWEEGCAVTNCRLRAVLRASHIKPWRSSTNKERLDFSNGLLLCAHLDALFDAGLISFRDDGKMLLSKHISSRDAANMQIPSSLRGKLTQSEKKFMSYHRANVFKA